MSSDDIDGLAGLATTVHHIDTAKIHCHQPDIFLGERNKLEKWLYRMDLHFKFKTVLDQEKPKYAMTFMRGKANEWVTAKYRAYVDRTDPDIKELFEDFDRFKEALRQVFGIADDAQIAAKTIQTLRQRTSAADYTAEFQSYAGELGCEDTALMAMYEQGLKDDIKDRLAFRSGTIEDLDGLIKAAIEIDDELHEGALEEKFRNHLPYRQLGQPGCLIARNDNRFPGPTQNNYGDPIENDAVEVEKLSDKGFKKEGSGKSDKRCYSCGKPGHLARNCRTKNMVQRRQINTAEYRIPEKEQDSRISKDPGESDWEVIPAWSPPRAPTPNPRFDTLRGNTSYKDLGNWNQRIAQDRKHADHVLLTPAEDCQDPKCEIFRHQQGDHGISQLIAMDCNHLEHPRLPRDLCLDSCCTIHFDMASEETNAIDTALSDKIIDNMEKELGSNPSHEMWTTTFAETNEEHEEMATHSRMYIDHKSFPQRCYDEDCMKLAHTEWRRTSLQENLQSQDEQEGPQQEHRTGFLSWV